MSECQYLVFSCSPIRGGAEEYGLTMVKALVPQGSLVRVACPDLDGTRSLVRDFVRAGAQHYSFDTWTDDCAWVEQRSLIGLYRSFRSALGTLRQVKPAAVMIVQPSPERWLGVLLAAALLRIPAAVVFQLVDRQLDFPSWLRGLYSWMRGRGQSWVAVSENNRDLLCQSFGTSSQEIEVVYNGVPPVSIQGGEALQARVRLRKELGLAPDDKVLLSVARLHRQKGHGVLIQAMASIDLPGSNIHYAWAGEGPLRGDLESQLEAAGMSEKVSLLGHRKDIPELLAASDLFLLPTLFEGFPFSLLEAAAQGVPIVASDASSITEFLTADSNGLVVPAGDHQALSSAVNWALRHPGEMRRMASAAQSLQRRFSMSAMTDRMCAILEEISA